MNDAAAIYFDGETAIAWMASCKLAGNSGLLISTAGSALKLWPLADLFLASPPAANAALTLGWGIKSNERLVVRDTRLAEQIVAASPPLRKALAKFTPWQWWQWIAGLVSAAMGVAIVAAALDAAPDLLTPLVPYDLEAKLGERLTKAMGNSMGLRCINPSAIAPLERLGRRLSGAAGWERPLTIQIINSPISNAFAAPGGQIVIFRGLFDKASSGDEVAGVFAHEVGHVVRRHSMRGVIRDLGLGVVVTLITGGASGDVGASVTNYGSKLLQLSYSRAAEREADEFAMKTLEAAGLRADGLVTFFVKLQEEERKRGEGPGWLGTHPPTPDRVAALKLAKATGGSAFTDAEWAELKKICGSIPPQRTLK